MRIELKETVTSSPLQEEVDRVAKKYEDSNDEFKVTGEHPKITLQDVERDSKVPSDEKIVNILKDL